MGLMAHQDYKVLNLWELDADLVLEQNWTTLLPFVPILRGGDDKATVGKALAQLRAGDQLADMETFLAFWATFVMTLDEIRLMMRWDMAMLRESPWYNAILEEGLDLGLQRGRQEGWQEGRQEGRQEGMREERVEMLLRILNRRFGEVPAELAFRIRGLGAEPLLRSVDVALMAPSLEVIAAFLADLPPARGDGNGDHSPA
jgi:predicted transposase YdaD